MKQDIWYSPVFVLLEHNYPPPFFLVILLILAPAGP